MFDHLFEISPEMFQAGYFDPNGRTSPSQGWRVPNGDLVRSWMAANILDSQSLIPVPHSLLEEPTTLTVTDTNPLQLYVVVAQQGTSVDLVQSFFQEDAAQKLASTIGAYAADDVKISVMSTVVET